MAGLEGEGVEVADSPEEEAPDFTPSAQPGNSGRGAGLASKLLKNKKALAAIALTVILLIGIGLLFLFLSLFKLNHIEKLFISYRFAQVHRAVGKRAGEILREADGRAKGSFADTVDTNSPLTEQIEKLNLKETLGEGRGEAKPKFSGNTFEGFTDGSGAKLEISDPKVQAELNRTVKAPVENVNHITSAEAIDPKFKVVRETKSPDEKLAPEEAEKAVREQSLEKVQGEPGDAAKAPTEDLRKEVTQAQEEVKKGSTPEEAAAKSAGESKLVSKLAVVSEVIFWSTIACIVNDIFGSGAKAYAEIKSGQFVRLAAETFTASSKQKQGKASLSEISTFNKRFDNGKESFTQSAAYARATGHPEQVGKANDLPEGDRPFDYGSGPLADMAQFITGNSIVAQAINKGCGVILNPTVQLGVAGAEVALLIGSGGGSKAITKAFTEAVKGLVLIEAAKILVPVAVKHYAHINVTGTESPIQSANKLDVGTTIMASETCKAAGCKRVTPKQAFEIRTQYFADLNKYDRQRGIAYRVFSLENPRSPLSMGLAKLPSTPNSALTSGRQMIASLLNPVPLIKRWSLIFFGPRPAFADTIDDAYGVPLYGLTDSELDSYPVAENAKYIEARPEIKQKYDHCFTDKLVDISDSSECNSNDQDLRRYRIYRMDKQVVRNFAVLGNKQAAYSSGSSTAPASTGGTGINGLKMPPGVGDASPLGYFQMPESPTREYIFNPGTCPQQRYGHKDLIAVIYTAALGWKGKYSDSVLMVGDLNAGHLSHRWGVAVDLYISNRSAMDMNHPAYGSTGRERTIEFGKMLLDTKMVKNIWFDDPAVTNALKAYAKANNLPFELIQEPSNARGQHHDHFHLDVSSPRGPDSSPSCAANKGKAF